MRYKVFEIVDRSTRIRVAALHVSSATTEHSTETRLIQQAGYGEVGCVYVIDLESGECQRDFTKWSNSTLCKAHFYIEQNFENLFSGNTINVNVT